MAGNRPTWRAEAEKQRRWAWKNACLAANMMNVMEMRANGDWVGLRGWTAEGEGGGGFAKLARPENVSASSAGRSYG